MAIYEGDSGLGAATTPEECAGYVLETLSHESVLLASGARRVDTTAKQIHVPRLTDSGDADWYAELDTIGPGDPTGDDLGVRRDRSGCRVSVIEVARADGLPVVGVANRRGISRVAQTREGVGRAGGVQNGCLTREQSGEQLANRKAEPLV